MKKSLTLIFICSALLAKSQENNATESIMPAFEEVEITCLSPTNAVKEFIINSEAEYKALWNPSSPHPDCESYVPPKIDFKTKTLILCNTSAGGCRRPNVVEKTVIKKVLEKKYIVLLRLYPNGICEKLWHIPFRLTIPKIEADYTVEFQYR